MTDLVLLETERLVLSGWNIDQVNDLVRLHGNPDVSRYLTLDGAPWTEPQAREAIESWIVLFSAQRLGKLRLTLKTDGAFIGRAGFGVYPPTAEPELGFALFAEHQGQGYATEAASALRDWIFAATNYDHFIGFADTRNAPSLAVLKRIGMTPTHVENEPGGLACQFHIYNRPRANV
ncbi:MAG: GNAT family N-acetyltransferase [Alphaproteobacteria bacterium]|nr:GNAT family N-acetyltransferase [Alphaproteobacteria bacterium]